jgi:hypothetical protein
VIVSGNSNTRVALRQETGPRFQFNSGAALNGPSFTTGTWYIASVGFDPAGDDNVAVNDETATTGNGGANTVTQYQMGNSSTPANVEISEWVVYESTLSSGDREDVIANMNASYSVF